jgi:hypothetical protein
MQFPHLLVTYLFEFWLGCVVLKWGLDGRHDTLHQCCKFGHVIPIPVDEHMHAPLTRMAQNLGRRRQRAIWTQAKHEWILIRNIGSSWLLEILDWIFLPFSLKTKRERLRWERQRLDILVEGRHMAGHHRLGVLPANERTKPLWDTLLNFQWIHILLHLVVQGMVALVFVGWEVSWSN